MRIIIFIIIIFHTFTLAFSNNDNIYDKVDLFGEVLDKVNKEYVEEIDQAEAMDAAIDGVLRSLDPYSAYLSPEDLKQMETETSGKFGGLGIEVGMEAGVVKVISPIDDTPASRAGIKAGDYIVKINDIQVQGKSLLEAVKLMRGPVGTSIDLTVRRKKVKKPLEFKIVRKIIEVQSVSSKIIGDEKNLGYIRLKSFNENKKRPNLRLRTVGSGGEALGEELLHWGKEILNVGINEFYGQTECNLTVSNNGSIMKQKLSSIGRPVPGHDVKLKNNEGNFITEENNEGEIVVEANSPSIFLGYWGNEKETNNKIINGWLHTGDYATFDNEGYFYFKGRKDDLINSSGYRIGPTEIENTILSLQEVEMVAVVGVPDELRGEIIKAVIVPREKALLKNKNENLKDKIKEHVKQNLAAHEYPRLIEFVKELPLTTTGKIKRNLIRKNHIEVKNERKI